jgi:hypothetical protein
MSLATLTLTEFLLARIAEDEAEAREGGQYDNGPLRWAEVGGISEVLIIGCDRVLAECEAKRRIIEDHPLGETLVVPDDVFLDEYTSTYCVRCVGWDDGPRSLEECRPACVTLRSLALPYADHPDFDPTWRS